MSRPVGEMGRSYTDRDEAEFDHAFPSLKQSGS